MTFDPVAYASEAASRRDAMTSAESELVAARERAAEAADALEAAEASLATISLEDLNRARFAAEASAAVLNRADVAVTVARSNLLQTDTSLAEALLPAVNASLPVGVSAVVLPVEPPAPAAVVEPVAYLAQLLEAQKDPESGQLWTHTRWEDPGTSVRLTYYRADRHRPISAAVISAAAARIGVELQELHFVDARETQLSDDLYRQEVDLKVLSAWSTTTTLPAGANLPEQALGILEDLARRALLGGDRPVADVTAAKVTWRNGRRLKVALTLAAGNHYRREESIRETLEEMLRGLAGSVPLPYLGTVESVEITGGRPGRQVGGRVVPQELQHHADLAHGWIADAVLTTAAS